MVLRDYDIENKGIKYNSFKFSLFYSLFVIAFHIAVMIILVIPFVMITLLYRSQFCNFVVYQIETFLPETFFGYVYAFIHQ